MKRSFLILAGAAAMVLASCSKTESENFAGEDGYVTITAQLPAATRAIADNGNGTSADRCVMKLYTVNGEETKEYGDLYTAEVSNLTATFRVRLLSNHSYKAVIWADNEADGAYNIDNFPTVTIDTDAYAGNTDARDAFYNVIEIAKEDLGKPVSAELYRPFGQLNITTLDWADVPEAYRPDAVKVTYSKFYNTVDLLTDMVSGEVNDVTYAAAADLMDNEGHLVMDYILAPVYSEENPQQFITDIKVTAFQNGAESTVKELSNIPFQRNYRTNIEGNLLTSETEFDIVIKPEFTKPDIVIDQLHTAAQLGGTVTLTEDLQLDETIVVKNGVSMTVDLNGHNISNTTDIWDQANYKWSLFSVCDGSTLTIKGDDNTAIAAKENDCYAVDVKNGSKVIIEGGNFTGNVHAVYVHEGTAEIKGGTFKVLQTYPNDPDKPYEFTLNCYDENRAANKAAIIVTGGKFYKFNPADCAAEGEHTNFLAEGYATKAVDTDWYEVVKPEAATAEALTDALAAGLPEITLTADVSASNSALNFTAANSTLDLGGHTLDAYVLNMMTDNQNLTIKNGDIKITNSDAGYGFYMFNPGVSLTLDNVNIDGSSLPNGGHAIIVGSAGDLNDHNDVLTIKNSTIKASGSNNTGIAIFGKAKKIEITDTKIEHTYFGITQHGVHPGTGIVLNNVDITGPYSAIYLSNNANGDTNALTIDGGTLTSKEESAIEVKKTDLTVKNATLVSEANTQSYTLNGGGSAGVGYGIVLAGYAADKAYEGNVTIENVTYKLAAGKDAKEVYRYNPTTNSL